MSKEPQKQPPRKGQFGSKDKKESDKKKTPKKATGQPDTVPEPEPEPELKPKSKILPETKKETEILVPDSDGKIKGILKRQKDLHPNLDPRIFVPEIFRRLNKPKIMVEIVDEERSIIKSAKIVNDVWLEFKIGRGRKSKRKVIILNQPKVLEIHRDNPLLSLILPLRRSLIWHVGGRAEATHDPEKAQLDIPQISIATNQVKVLLKSDVLEAAAKATPKTKTTILEIILAVGITLIGIASMYFIVETTKALSQAGAPVIP